MWDDILKNTFPNAVTQADYVARSQSWLEGLGFTAENSLLCLGTCRDEIARPLRTALQDVWGDAFSLSGLGGLVFAGKTGLGAAAAHVPTRYDRKRLILFVFSHIGIDTAGHLGAVQRRGQDHVDHACGALLAFQKALSSGQVDATVRSNDAEQGLLTRRLLKILSPETHKDADLATITRSARDAALADVTALVHAALDPESWDYALLSGIQIHTPDGERIDPGPSHAVCQGQRKDFSLASAS